MSNMKSNGMIVSLPRGKFQSGFPAEEGTKVLGLCFFYRTRAGCCYRIYGLAITFGPSWLSTLNNRYCEYRWRLRKRNPLYFIDTTTSSGR